MENPCSFHGVSWYSMEIPWKPCYSMEVTPGHHMNFPWSTTMAMEFHKISMVTHFINACYKALLLKAVFIEKSRRQIFSGERNVNVST